MRYIDAKKLQNGDEVMIKATKNIVRVINIYSPRPTNMINRKVISVDCDDGNTYHHTELR